MKTCRACGETKPLDEFHKASKTPDGRQYRCKPCSIAAARQRAIDNPEAKREADRRYRQTEKYKANRKARREGPQRGKILDQKRQSYARNKVESTKRVREARIENPERFRGYYQRKYAKDREAILAKNREWQHANIDKLRYYRRKRSYGIAPEEFDRKLLEQDGRCEICNVEMHLLGELVNGRPRTGICVDHDHATGAVRGLICPGCNKALGYFKDDPDRMRAAADYIEKYRRPA